MTNCVSKSREVLSMCADLTMEDNANYTCEIRGNKSNVLASKTFSITVQGTRTARKWFLTFCDNNCVVDSLGVFVKIHLSHCGHSFCSFKLYFILHLHDYFFSVCLY